MDEQDGKQTNRGALSCVRTQLYEICGHHKELLSTNPEVLIIIAGRLQLYWAPNKMMWSQSYKTVRFAVKPCPALSTRRYFARRVHGCPQREGTHTLTNNCEHWQRSRFPRSILVAGGALLALSRSIGGYRIECCLCTCTTSPIQQHFTDPALLRRDLVRTSSVWRSVPRTWPWANRR